MAMLAGMTRGTPDWQLDRAYEQESERLWEAQNAHDEAWNKMLDAVGYLNVALEHLDKATTSLVGAKDKLDGLPSEYRLGSLIDSYEDLVCDIRAIRQKFINGEEV